MLARVGAPIADEEASEIAALVREILRSDPAAVRAALRRLALSWAPAPVPTGPHRLTRRESAVAQLLAIGKSNSEIATALSISEHTCRHHTERVLAKLGVRSRAAVAAAMGLVGADGWGSAA